MDSITDQLSQLQELDNDQLSELENSVLSEFESASGAELSAESVDNLETLANAVEAIRTETSRRAAAMESLSAKAEEAKQRVASVMVPEPTPVEQDPGTSVNPEEGKVENTDEVPSDAPPDDEKPDDPPPVGNAFAAKEGSKAEEDAESKAEEKKEKEKDGKPFSAETPEGSEASADVPKEAEASADNTTSSEDSAPEAELSADEQPAAVASDSSDDNANTTTSTEANVTAAAEGTGSSAVIVPPEDRKPQLKPAATTMSITAGADIPGISAGAKFNDMLSVGDAFAKRLHTLRHVHGGDGEQHIVASLRYDYPESRILESNDPASNTDKIQAITSPESITAAAGICLPLEMQYDMNCDIGVTDRPVRDSLARFSADRGGIRYFSAPSLTDEAAATGFWRGDSNGQNWHTYGPDGTTATNPANLKPCLEVQCTSELTAYIEAITLCLTFNNLTVRTFPELIKRHNELALVAHARIAENHLLNQIEAGSTQITAQAQVVGASREIFNLLGRAVASYRYKHRMNSVTPLRMIAPMWVMDLMRSDLALQMPGDGVENTLGVAEATINSWFRARGVNITWHLDGVGPAVGDLDDGGAGTAVGFEYPTSIEFALFAEGAWLYLDGGTLDLGVIRDSTLVATNQYKEFVETFEGVANMGCDSYWVTAAYRPTGAAAALQDTM